MSSTRIIDDEDEARAVRERDEARAALVELEAEVRWLGEAHPLDAEGLPGLLQVGVWADGNEYVFVEEPEFRRCRWRGGVHAEGFPRIAALLRAAEEAEA